MYVAIIDDSIEERSNTALLIQNACEELNLSACKFDFYESAEHYLKECDSKKYDLIILDIFMDQLTGMDLAFKIRETDQEVRLVFASSSNDFACESYSVNASYYIQKPLKQEKVLQMMKKIQGEIAEDALCIVLPDKQKLLLRNIVYAEYGDHIMTIYCKDSRVITTRMAFYSFLDLIKDCPFFLVCNKGTVVNMYEICSIEKNILETTSGEVLTVSRRRINEVNTQYQDFLFDLARKELTK